MKQTKKTSSGIWIIAIVIVAIIALVITISSGAIHDSFFGSIASPPLPYLVQPIPPNGSPPNVILSYVANQTLIINQFIVASGGSIKAIPSLEEAGVTNQDDNFVTFTDSQGTIYSFVPLFLANESIISVKIVVYPYTGGYFYLYPSQVLNESGGASTTPTYVNPGTITQFGQNAIATSEFYGGTLPLKNYSLWYIKGSSSKLNGVGFTKFSYQNCVVYQSYNVTCIIPSNTSIGTYTFEIFTQDSAQAKVWSLPSPLFTIQSVAVGAPSPAPFPNILMILQQILSGNYCFTFGSQNICV